MKFQYCSDLHLEFRQNSDYLINNPIIPQAKVLLLAGDITYLQRDFFENPFFDYVSQNWEKTYWIPGNHEYYCGIDVLSYNLNSPLPIRENVFLLDNCSVDIEGICLIFSTLWSTIDKKYQYLIENRVSDFECIIYNGKKLSSDDFNLLHKISVNYLMEALNENKNKTNIIVTHHLPSNQCNSPKFKGSTLNSAFVSNLDNIIENCNAPYWIFGHSHENVQETIIGNTKLVCNQLGYVHQNEHRSFDKARTISI